MWVYKRINSTCFVVGHYAPGYVTSDGDSVAPQFIIESEHKTAELAAAHVHYLNGGSARG